MYFSMFSLCFFYYPEVYSPCPRHPPEGVSGPREKAHSNVRSARPARPARAGLAARQGQEQAQKPKQQKQQAPVKAGKSRFTRQSLVVSRAAGGGGGFDRTERS